jgi:hypothetical protein
LRTTKRRCLKPGSDLRIGQLLDNPQTHGLALLGGQTRQQLAGWHLHRSQRYDTVELLVIETDRIADSNAPARASFHPSPPHAFGELVLRDREQPRRGGWALLPIARRGCERRGEDLCREISGDWISTGCMDAPIACARSARLGRSAPRWATSGR